MLKYLELKCYDVCNLLSEVSERQRKTNVGKMSTIGKSRSLGEGYIGGCSLFDQM